MKKIIVSTLLLIVSATTISQPVSNPAPTLKTDYLQKSKDQKTVAWVMLVGGTTFILIGELLRNSDKSTSSGLWEITGGNSFYDMMNSPSSIDLSTQEVFAGIGVVSIACSVPLFISSAKNKKKGMSLSFKNEAAPQIQRSSFTHKSIPSLSLKINL